jgi:hypothetical protein
LFNDATTCTEDPGGGVCGCTPVHASAFSGDVVMGDGTYTLETSLTLPFLPSPVEVGKGCVLESRPQSLLLNFQQNTPLTVSVRATDRVGNVGSTAATFTPRAASMSCSGDACGCCLMLSTNVDRDCSGLPGMTSPDLPAGLCRAF